MGLNNDQEKGFAEYYDVTLKMTFDLLDVTCDEFIFIIL